MIRAPSTRPKPSTCLPMAKVPTAAATNMKPQPICALPSPVKRVRAAKTTSRIADALSPQSMGLMGSAATAGSGAVVIIGVAFGEGQCQEFRRSRTVAWRSLARAVGRVQDAKRHRAGSPGGSAWPLRGPAGAIRRFRRAGRGLEGPRIGRSRPLRLSRGGP